MRDTAELGERLDGLWDRERCVWHVDYHGHEDAEWRWVVVLEWTQEYGNQHHADWTTFTWLFYGDSTKGALTQAVEWCESLIPLRRCGACDGEGEYNRQVGERVTCEECRGSGLASMVIA